MMQSKNLNSLLPAYNMYILNIYRIYIEKWRWVRSLLFDAVPKHYHTFQLSGKITGCQLHYRQFQRQFKNTCEFHLCRFLGFITGFKKAFVWECVYVPVVH